MPADRYVTRSVRGTEERGAGWGLAVALVVLALLLALVASRRQPSAPRPESGPATEFSGVRAQGVLRELLGDGAPHPVGSPADAAVRDRIVARLRSAGLSPEVQQGFACSRDGNSCAQVQDVVARLDGSQPTGAVLLLAHYDSVPAGPGAGDDMAGVAAILEVARLLKAGPPLRNTIFFMLDEGEEAGLLGARWFADHSPLASQVKAVVNLEARGTSGPSLMFETSGENGWLVPLYTANAPHPVTSSVYATIYELMPNDTDLTVFKRRPSPVPGLNFAFVGEPAHYHTPADSLANLSPASLQHHGENALAAVRGLAQADLARPPRGRLVFFDVLGAFVVSWPMAWSLLLALAALILALVGAAVAVRRGATTGGGVATGFFAFLLTIVLSGLLAFGLSLVAPRIPWVAQPLPLVAVFWLLPLAVAGFLAVSGLGRRAGAAGIWAGTWLGWALIGLLLVVALPAPGVSYLFVVPALVAVVADLLLAGARGVAGPGGTFAALLAAAVAAILWFPILIPLYDGLGAGALVPIAALAAIFFTAIAPLFATALPFLGRLAPLAALLAAIVCLVLAILAPKYSAASPQPLNVLLHEDADRGQTRWIVSGTPPFPPGLRQAAAFAQDQPAFPWSPSGARLPAAPAPALGAPAPELTVLEDSASGGQGGGQRHLRLRLISPRHAPSATVFIPAAASLQSVTIDGFAVPVKPAPFFGWYRQTLLTLPPQGAELDVVLGNGAPSDWYVNDRTFSLPPQGDALRRARPANAAPIQDGDVTIVSRKVKI
jgi:Peptidase family M28